MESIKKHGFLYHTADVVLNVIIIVAIVAAIRTFLVSPFQVEGSSMVDTLEDNQYIVINKLAYHIGSPDRGDVVVFRPPKDEKKYYVKRIIGMPGDKVTIRGGYVYITPLNSEEEIQIEENYLNDSNAGHTFRHPPQQENKEEISYSVPEGEYFLLGDNRKGSLDSRSFGAQDSTNASIPEDNIKGRVWFIALPIKKIHAIKPQMYNF